MGFGSIIVFDTWLLYFLGVWLWVNSYNSLNLSLLYHGNTILILSTLGLCEDGLNLDVCKTLYSAVPFSRSLITISSLYPHDIMSRYKDLIITKHVGRKGFAYGHRLQGMDNIWFMFSMAISYRWSPAVNLQSFLIITACWVVYHLSRSLKHLIVSTDQITQMFPFFPRNFAAIVRYLKNTQSSAN